MLPRLEASRALRTVAAPRRVWMGGFTLLELIIALALVALITVLLFSGLHLGSRAWEAVDRVAERNADLRSARGFLDSALEQARDVVLRYDDENRQVFAGGTASLEFVAPLSEHVGIPGLYVLRLGVEGRGEHARLVLTRWLLHTDVLAGDSKIPQWQPLDPSSPGVSADRAEDRDLAAGAFGQTVLLEGVGEFALAYFGVPEEEGLGGTGPTSMIKTPRPGRGGLGGEEPEGKWYDEWVDQPHPPELVRIHLTSLRQDWPDSIIRLPQMGQGQQLPSQLGVTEGTQVPDGTAGDAPAAESQQGLGQ